MKVVMNVGQYKLTFDGDVYQSEDTVTIKPTSIPMWSNPSAIASSQWMGITDPSLYEIDNNSD